MFLIETENVVYKIVNGRLVPKDKKVNKVNEKKVNDKKVNDKKIKEREAFKKAISDLIDKYLRGVGKRKSKVTPVFGAVVEEINGSQTLEYHYNLSFE